MTIPRNRETSGIIVASFGGECWRSATPAIRLRAHRRVEAAFHPGTIMPLGNASHAPESAIRRRVSGLAR